MPALFALTPGPVGARGGRRGAAAGSPRWRLAIAAWLAVLLLLATATQGTVSAFSAITSNPGNVTQAARSFRITQLAGTAACVSDSGTSGACADGTALLDAWTPFLSPDGAHLYVASPGSDGLAVFSRDAATGALTQLGWPSGCITETGSFFACTDGVALSLPYGVAVSPDGAHVYSTSWWYNAVAAFARNSATGALTQLPGTAACVSDDTSGGVCADGRGLLNATGVVLDPEGRNVYVKSVGSDGIAAFNRNAATGALTQLTGLNACVTDTGADFCTDGRALVEPWTFQVSPDGKNLYMTAEGSDAIAVFGRNPGTGSLTQLSGTAGCISETGAEGCADGEGLDGVRGLAISPDGRHVYVTTPWGDDRLSVFSRDLSSGALTQLPSCHSEFGTGGCTAGRGLGDPNSITISPDGENLYTAGQWNDEVGVFFRDPLTGTLTQRSGTGACVQESGANGCADGVGLVDPINLVVSPDGAHLYVTTIGSDAVAAFAR